MSALFDIRNPTPASRDPDVRLLLGISSLHYLYRKFAEALNILSVAEVRAPHDRAVLEFKIVLLIELHEYAAALEAVEAFECTVPDTPVEIARMRRMACAGAARERGTSAMIRSVVR